MSCSFPSFIYLLNYLFILIWTHRCLFYSMAYNPLLPLFWCSKYPRFGHWPLGWLLCSFDKSVWGGGVLFFLSTFLYFGTTRCSRLTLYFLRPSESANSSRSHGPFSEKWYSQTKMCAPGTLIAKRRCCFRSSVLNFLSSRYLLGIQMDC